MAEITPLAYGYVRDDLLHERRSHSVEDRLRDAARSFGYELAGVFREPAPQRGTLPPAFVELVQECRRADAHTVITLQGHMSGMSVCRMVLHAVLEVRAEAAVQEISL
jgi:hypothetical protein